MPKYKYILFVNKFISNQNDPTNKRDKDMSLA